MYSDRYLLLSFLLLDSRKERYSFLLKSLLRVLASSWLVSSPGWMMRGYSEEPARMSWEELMLRVNR